MPCHLELKHLVYRIKNLGEAMPMEKQVTVGLWGWWTGGAVKPEAGSSAAFIEIFGHSIEDGLSHRFSNISYLYG